MTSAVSDFYADLATENRMEESPILNQNKKIMDQYLKSMEDLETELLALDLLLEIFMILILVTKKNILRY